MILTIDDHSPVPPYEQIRAQIQTMMHAGVLSDGVRLPSIRQLARDLGLATGTVARAYRELERDRIVTTRGRHGTSVTANARLDQEDREQEVAKAAAGFAVAARQRGAGLNEAVRALRAAFSELPNEAT